MAISYSYKIKDGILKCPLWFFQLLLKYETLWCLHKNNRVFHMAHMKRFHLNCHVQIMQWYNDTKLIQRTFTVEKKKKKSDFKTEVWLYCIFTLWVDVQESSHQIFSVNAHDSKFAFLQYSTKNANNLQIFLQLF